MSVRIGIREELVDRLAERLVEHADVVERLQLVRDRVRRRIHVVAVELTELEAQRATRRLGVTAHAVAAARERPGLRADGLRLAGGEEHGVAPVVEPLVRVAVPPAVVVAHEEARLGALAARP